MMMKPPIKGANKGPVKTVMEKTVMARPRVLLSNISEKMAATTANGQEPKTPAKKRVNMTVCRSLAVAVAIEKTEKPNMATTRGSLLPRSSDKGAQRMGPVANPRTYNETPSTPTSVETENTEAMT